MRKGWHFFVISDCFAVLLSAASGARLGTQRPNSAFYRKLYKTITYDIFLDLIELSAGKMDHLQFEDRHGEAENSLRLR